ncbi:MAG: phosphoribosyl-AMP cyclohydrolase [bacterium]|nr:phosphoribosyl-AMP cyclohydrolase [bacterium]
MKEITEKIKFDEKGLVCVIVQDVKDNEVLMVAYMNQEALEETLTSGKTCFYSRSRQKLWRKGESSGHIQRVKEVYIDCDGDAVLIKVEQIGGACHTGYRSCFYRKVDNNRFIEVGEKVFNEEQVYQKKK